MLIINKDVKSVFYNEDCGPLQEVNRNSGACNQGRSGEYECTGDNLGGGSN